MVITFSASPHHRPSSEIEFWMPQEVIIFFFRRSTSLQATLQRPLPGEVAIVSRAALKGSEGRKFDTLGGWIFRLNEVSMNEVVSSQ